MNLNTILLISTAFAADAQQSGQSTSPGASAGVFLLIPLMLGLLGIPLGLIQPKLIPGSRGKRGRSVAISATIAIVSFIGFGVSTTDAERQEPAAPPSSLTQTAPAEQPQPPTTPSAAPTKQASIAPPPPPDAQQSETKNNKDSRDASATASASWDPHVLQGFLSLMGASSSEHGTGKNHTIEVIIDLDKTYANVKVMQGLGMLNQNKPEEFFLEYRLPFIMKIANLSGTYALRSAYMAPGIDNVTMTSYYIDKDNYGHPTKHKVYDLQFTKEIADQINWDGFDDVKLPVVAKSFDYDPLFMASAQTR